MICTVLIYNVTFYILNNHNLFTQLPKTQEELHPNADIGRQTMQLITPIKYVQQIGRALKNTDPLLEKLTTNIQPKG